MGYRQINQRGMNLITGFESFRAVAYDDQQPNRTRWTSVSQVRGVPTIGFGHTRGVTKQDIINRRRITLAEAMLLKHEDLIHVYATIYAVLPLKVIDHLNDDQYAALVSFVYNCGLSPSWTITRLLKAYRFKEVPAQLARFVHDNGKRVQGLVNRRNAEIDLWNSRVTVATGATGVVEAAPGHSVFASRTVKAAVLAGVAALAAPLSAAIGTLAPFAMNSPYINGVLTVCVLASSVCAFLAAFYRSQDMKAQSA